VAAPSQARSTLRQQVVTHLTPADGRTDCVLADQTRVSISDFLAGFVLPGDQLEFDVLRGSGEGIELRIIKNGQAGRSRELYEAPIGYVTKPKPDKRQELFLRAEVVAGGLGISAIHLTNEAVRNYFYTVDRKETWSQQQTLYQTLGSSPAASLSDMRLAFRVRQLELQVAHTPKPGLQTLERAFNILGNLELRQCYDDLLVSAEAPALFPYGGFGSILVCGELSRDGNRFFAHRILSFLPTRRQRRFRAALRKVDFYDDRAVYRDSRRKVEVVFDANLLPLGWDATWNQWKHLLGAKIGIEATFVKSGTYRLHAGQWYRIDWELALPSRIQVELPSNIQEAIEAARRAHHRFGQYSAPLERIREQIAQRPIERSELSAICTTVGMPSDFDIAQITWHPDYDPFFYRELCRRARGLYLFRNEYIFDLEQTVVVEVPQLGHATYLFAKPRSFDEFVARYAGTTKEDIRKNRGNVAQTLGFLGRIIHGSDPRHWLRELRARIGERVKYLQTLE